MESALTDSIANAVAAASQGEGSCSFCGSRQSNSNSRKLLRRSLVQLPYQVLPALVHGRVLLLPVHGAVHELLKRVQEPSAGGRRWRCSWGVGAR